MESYRYALFTVLQPVEMYPLVITDGPIEDFKADSEDQFTEGLQRVFASEKSQKIIQALDGSKSILRRLPGVRLCNT